MKTAPAELSKHGGDVGIFQHFFVSNFLLPTNFTITTETSQVEVIYSLILLFWQGLRYAAVQQINVNTNTVNFL